MRRWALLLLEHYLDDFRTGWYVKKRHFHRWVICICFQHLVFLHVELLHFAHLLQNVVVGIEEGSPEAVQSALIEREHSHQEPKAEPERAVEGGHGKDMIPVELRQIHVEGLREAGVALDW